MADVSAPEPEQEGAGLRLGPLGRLMMWLGILSVAFIVLVIVAPINPWLPAATRQTFDVDRDLGTTSSGPHIDVAALVQVTSGPGLIVERPWYFNNLGVNSGTDAAMS